MRDSSSLPVKNPVLPFARLGFIAVFLLMLMTPAVLHLSGKMQGETAENRVLATRPGLPLDIPQLLKFPAQADAFLNDHFGLRSMMVAWNNKLRYHLLGDINAVQLTAGKDGYIFFNSHAASAPLSMVNFLCGKNVSAENRAEIVRTASDFMQLALQVQPKSHLLLVPTKPVVYADKLPAWLQQQCSFYTPPLPAIVTVMQAQPVFAGKVIYPLVEMQALKSRWQVYPKLTFHWTGDGPQPIAQLVAESHLQRSRLITLKGKLHDVPSDIQQFLPGVALMVPTNDPDYASAAINACEGAGCFPEFKGIADKIGDATRYRHQQKKGPRLLLISDSFGHGVAGFFSEYFGEVWHVSMNDLNQLSTGQRQAFRKILFDDYAPDEVLYVFHDAAVSYFDRQAGPLLKAGQ
ncbi:hypothetical protein [Undibacterium sp. TS12]|uniref:hypothetical protein n=1 Tax=Undibacterium sp. TS12 TaxID=2908202 RepID=UPI001F4C5E16|nr:hypothetical protein [Undibacterium sp. TS12]MCH8619383.1 hypothetical protein [Undibacterium sp. TS12]